ncbi:a-factor receptor [Serendipita sp. 411]|nr:a-factor receptor [Serendipita sp. 411]
MAIEHPSAPPGLSALFPAVPLLCFLSFTFCILLLPGFIKTRVFALIFYVVWSSLGNILIGVNMCIWRNSTRDAPIYADIAARIIDAYSMTLYTSICCFAKFTWNMTRPASSLKFIDQRKQNNHFDASICIGLTFLWCPLFIIVNKGRYLILEDIGPLPIIQPSIVSFFVQTTPLIVTTVVSVSFSFLTGINIWRARQSGSHTSPTGLGIPGQPLYRPLSTLLALRYSALAFTNILGMTFGCLWAIIPFMINRNAMVDDDGRPWYTNFDIRNNLKQLPLTYTLRREEVGDWLNMVGFLIAVPCNGILFFVMFGLSSDTLAIYRVWLDPLRLQMSNTIQKFTPRTLWSSRGSSSSTYLENITPFRLDDILLDSLPPPVQPTRKVDPAPDVPVPLPVAISPPSPISPYHPRPITDRVSPISPLERARTISKEPMPLRLLPVNRSNSYGSPRDASFSVNSPRYTSFSHYGPRNASFSRAGPGEEAFSHNSPRDDVPVRYAPAGRRGHPTQRPNRLYSPRNGGTL